MQLRSSLSVLLHLSSILFNFPSFLFSFFFSPRQLIFRLHSHVNKYTVNAPLSPSSPSSPLFPPPAFHCSMALGMESGKISDDQITASTTFYDNRWLARQARLNNDDNAWTPSEDSNKEYIQVRF